MTAVLRKAMRDLRRRRLQVVVVFITTVFAVTTSAGFSRVANRDHHTLRVSSFSNSICC